MTSRKMLIIKTSQIRSLRPVLYISISFLTKELEKKYPVMICFYSKLIEAIGTSKQFCSRLLTELRVF